MNELCIYIMLSYEYSTPKFLLNHHPCAASTWMMWWQPQYNGGH